MIHFEPCARPAISSTHRPGITLVKNHHFSPESGRPRRQPMLTRRGRLLVQRWSGLLVVGVIAVGGAAQLACQSHAVTPRTAVVRTRFVTAQPGDTVWRLAERYGDSDTPVQATVDHLLTWNHLTAAAILQPGQTVRVSP